MAPKVESSKPGGSSRTAQIPDIIDMGLLRKRRGVAKGSFTRIIYTLQTLHDVDNLSEVKIKVEAEFKRLDQALEKVIQRHEEFMIIRMPQKVTMNTWIELKNHMPT
jgi:hypothetical protein